MARIDYIAECSLRLTLAGSEGRIFVDLAWSSDWNYDQVFLAAHQHADGTLPTVDDCNDQPALWRAALALRRAEDQLRAHRGED